MEATSVYDQISAQNDFWFAWHQLQQELYWLSCKTGPDETGGHSIIYICPQVHDDRRTDPEPRPTAPACGPCKRSFKRNQEYKRHMRDVHTDSLRDQKPDCPFCTFKWTRPDKIKDHIITAHKECLAPDILLEIAALRGKRLTQYLDRLSQGTNREAAFQSISSSYDPLRVSV